MATWLWHCPDCGTEVRAGTIDSLGMVCGPCSDRRERVASLVMTAARQVARERQARIEAVLA